MSSSTVAGLSGRLVIDLDAVFRNWQALNNVTPDCVTAAVVKADAYGCGLRECAPVLYAAGARFFFVATVDEALTLRTLLPNIHVFVLNGLYPGTGRLYAAERLIPVISSLPMLDEWLKLCVEMGEALPAALHFDTGMNRLGFRLNEVSLVKRQIDALGFVPAWIMSHLACADQPQHEKNRTQLALFESVRNQFPNIPASLANSAGMLTSRAHHYQMVRPGIAVYGGRAVNGRRNPMAPVATLTATILQVKEAKTGESVGYGASQTLGRDSRLGIVSIGYGDGFLRSFSSVGGRHAAKAFVRGRSCPIVGRVSMDLIAIDLTELGANPPVPGESVELFGSNLAIDEQADAAGTIAYELLTATRAGRYERIYVGGGRR